LVEESNKYGPSYSQFLEFIQSEVAKLSWDYFLRPNDYDTFTFSFISKDFRTEWHNILDHKKMLFAIELNNADSRDKMQPIEGLAQVWGWNITARASSKSIYQCSVGHIKYLNMLGLDRLIFRISNSNINQVLFGWVKREHTWCSISSSFMDGFSKPNTSFMEAYLAW
jgi:hypothetical protein